MYVYSRSVIGIRDALLRLYDDTTTTHKVDTLHVLEHSTASLNTTVAASVELVNAVLAKNGT